MLKVILDSKMPPIDGKTRMDLERAKKVAKVDRSFTTFKGQGSITKEELSKVMVLSRTLKKEKYM